MSAMLGVIRPSLAGWSLMVLREEDAGVCIGPNITSEASPQTDPPWRSTLFLVGLRRSFTGTTLSDSGRCRRNRVRAGKRERACHPTASKTRAQRDCQRWVGDPARVAAGGAERAVFHLDR